MKRVEILVEESLYEFYRKVGAQAGGLPAERVMADALLKLAGGAGAAGAGEKAAAVRKEKTVEAQLPRFFERKFYSAG